MTEEGLVIPVKVQTDQTAIKKTIRELSAAISTAFDEQARYAASGMNKKLQTFMLSNVDTIASKIKTLKSAGLGNLPIIQEATATRDLSWKILADNDKQLARLYKLQKSEEKILGRIDKSNDRVYKSGQKRNGKLNKDLENSNTAQKKDTAQAVRETQRGATLAAYQTMAFATRTIHKIIGFTQKGIENYLKEATETGRTAFQLGLPSGKLQRYSKLVELYGGNPVDFFNSIRGLNAKLARIAIMPGGKKSGSRIAAVIKQMGLQVKDKNGKLKDDLTLISDIMKLLPKYSRGEQQGVLQMLGFNKDSQRVIMDMSTAWKKYGKEIEKLIIPQKELADAIEITEQKGLTKMANTRFFSSITSHFKPFIVQIEKLKRLLYGKGTESPGSALATTVLGVTGATYAFGKLALAIQAAGGAGAAFAAVMSAPITGGVLTAIAALSTMGIITSNGKNTTWAEANADQNFFETYNPNTTALNFNPKKQSEYRSLWFKSQGVTTEGLTGASGAMEALRGLAASTKNSIASANLANGMKYAGVINDTKVTLNGGVNINVAGSMDEGAAATAGDVFTSTVTGKIGNAITGQTN